VPGIDAAAVAPSAGRVVLSEVSLAPPYVELYNAGSLPRELAGWTVDDGDPRTPPIDVGSEPIAGFGFRVLDDVVLAPRAVLRLLRPDGSVADLVVLPVLQPSRSFSRFPVHGGGWVAGTPQTMGVYNLPAAATPTPAATATATPEGPAGLSSRPETAAASAPAATATADAQNQSAGLRWWWLVLPALVGAGGAWLLRHYGMLRRIGL